MQFLFAAIGLLAMVSAAQAAPADAVQQLAPTGTLRVSINLGNPVLAQKDPSSGELGGVSVALARR